VPSATHTKLATSHAPAAPNEAGGKIKERRRSGKVNTVAHEVYGPSNQINNAADGSLGGGQGVLSQNARQAALQALAFQLGWDIVMAHLVPGYMQNKAIVLAAGFFTSPLMSMSFFDKKYFTQPGGQVAKFICGALPNSLLGICVAYTISNKSQ
jgi:hypothetical protein